jgi:hypothetical protein
MFLVVVEQEIFFILQSDTNISVARYLGPTIRGASSTDASTISVVRIRFVTLRNQALSRL